MGQAETQQAVTGSVAQPEIEPVTIELVVRQVLGDVGARVERWKATPLKGGYGGAGVYRVCGDARCDDGSVSWRVVLKQRSRADRHLISAEQNQELAEDGWLAWDREFLTYTSGALDALPDGLRAARCLLAEAPTPDMRRLWLEDLGDRQVDGAPLDRYTRIAECLGRFNGAYLAGRPLPNAPHLGHDWLRARTIANPLALIDERAGRGLLELVATPEMRAGVGRLLNERERLLEALNRLPRTFCHRDAWPPNIFLQAAGDPVAIDWEYAGIGAVGEDLGSLVIGMQNVNDIPVAQQEHAARLIFDAYLAGLRSAGWPGDARLARLGCTMFVSLLDVLGIYSQVVVLFGSTPEAQLDAFYQNWVGLSAREAAEVIRELFTQMFRLGDEALQLADELGM